MNEEELVARIAALRAAGANEAEITAFVQSAGGGQPAAQPRRAGPGRAVAAGAMAAGNTFTAKALPNMLAALGVGQGDSYADRVASLQADFKEAKEEFPGASKAGSAVGLAGQVLAPVGRVAGLGVRGLGALARAGAASGGISGGAFGALGGLAGSDPNTGLGGAASSAVAGGAAGGTVGAAGGAAFAPAAGLLGRGFSRMVESFRGVGRPAGAANAMERGRASLADAANRRGTVPNIAERAALHPEVRRATPMLAHMGPEEMTEWARGVAQDPKAATKLERDLRRLWRVGREAGEEMDRAVFQYNRAGEIIGSPLTRNPQVPQQLAAEASESPAVLDHILSVSDRLHRIGGGRQAGFTSKAHGELVRAMQEAGNSPNQIRRAVAQEIADAPWTLEALNELRRSTQMTATKGLQPGQSDPAVSKVLANFSDKVTDLLYADPSAGPQLRRANEVYRQTRRMTSEIAERTGAVPKMRGKGEIDPGVWRVPTNQQQLMEVSTPEARALASVVMGANAPGGLGAGGTSALIAGFRAVPGAVRAPAQRAAAHTMLRTGDRGTEALQDVARLAAQRRAPRPISVLQAAAGSASGVAAGGLLGRPAGSFVSQFAPPVPQQPDEELGPLDPRRFFPR